MSTVETVTPEAAAPESTLSSEVGQMLGEYGPSGASEPEPSTPSDGPTPDAAEPDSETAPELDGETAGAELASEGTPPDAQAALVEDDPFKDTTPATYMVNGKAVPVEDIRVFKEGGAVIRPESLPNILSKLAERDTLSEKYRASDANYQTLAKVSEWTDPDGKQYSGPEAAIEMRIGNAGLFAENKLLVEHLTDPDKLFALLATEQVPDGKGGLRERVVVNPDALRNLQRENALQQRELSATIRDHYKSVMAQAVSAPPIDFAQAAPGLIAQVAAGSNLDASVLTAQDTSILAKHLPFHTRNGQASVEWQELVKDRIQDRLAQRTSTTKVVDATTKAVKEGQARMLAAARGVKPAQARPAPTRPAAAPSPQVERSANEGDLFDAMLRSSASAMRTAR